VRVILILYSVTKALSHLTRHTVPALISKEPDRHVLTFTCNRITNKAHEGVATQLGPSARVNGLQPYNERVVLCLFRHK
jgi:hypothetical protein